MFFTLEKLTARIPQIIAAATRAAIPIPVQTHVAPGSANEAAMSPPPAADSPGWQPLALREPWGRFPGSTPGALVEMIDWGIPANGGSTHWLQARFRVPEEWRGQPVLLGMEWQGVGQSSLEAIAYLNGEVLAGIDDFHRTVLLPQSAHDGEQHLLLRCYVPFEQPFGGLELRLRDETIFQLGHAMRTVCEVIATYRDSDAARHSLLDAVNAAYNTLDLREGWQSARFAESARVALQEFRERLEQMAASTDSGAGVPRPTLIGTGHAHLDTAWLWPLWRTRQKVAHTVATALQLMERYPEYRFSMSQPHVYNYLKHDDPTLYERMKQRILEGRFEPVGMMWIEADCNLSSGESLARQLLHGARFFREEFGDASGAAAPHVVWLPDVFGYSAALPQLMRLAGLDSFMTTKISWNQFNRMPYDTFRWRGIDGTDVLAHFVTVTDMPMTHWANPQFYTYNAHMTGGEVYGTWNHYRQKAINHELLYIYGWGDGGGGPTEEMLESAQTLRNLPNFPQVQLGRVDDYFKRLYERVWNNPRLPIWSGELYLEYHRGTYTSQARTKQANRLAELTYRTAEWLNAWATTQGAPNQQDTLDQGWQLIMLNQFHDILPGSSVPLVYAESNEQYAHVQQLAREVSQNALGSLLGGATATETVVLNSLPWPREELVQLPLTDDAPAPDLGERPSQPIETLSGERAILLDAAVPSYGYATLSQSRPSSAPRPVRADGRTALENDELRIEFDDNGEIVALHDLRNRRQVLAAGSSANQLVLYEDRPLNWEAWDIDAFYEEKPYPVHDIVDWRIVEQGPLRAAIEIVRRTGRSTIRQRISLAHNSRRIDFETEVDWHERQSLLRALFPLNINAIRATCEIQFGAVERPTHRNTSWDWARFEVCAHRWVDLSEGDYGVALLNNGKYGHSLHHNTLGLSLLKGSIHPDANADLGLHRFTYSLLPHAGDWRTGEVVRRAYELNAPLFVSANQRPARAQASFLSTECPHIVVETVKMAQDGDGLIVRLYEAHNQRGTASISFERPIASAAITDLHEREIGALAVEGNTLTFDVRPFEIKTLRVRLA